MLNLLNMCVSLSRWTGSTNVSKYNYCIKYNIDKILTKINLHCLLTNRKINTHPYKIRRYEAGIVDNCSLKLRTSFYLNHLCRQTHFKVKQDLSFFCCMKHSSLTAAFVSMQKMKIHIVFLVFALVTLINAASTANSAAQDEGKLSNDSSRACSHCVLEMPSLIHTDQMRWVED